MHLLWRRLARRNGGLPSWLLCCVGASSLLTLTSALARVERDPFSLVLVTFSLFLLVVVAASFVAKRQGRCGIEV